MEAFAQQRQIRAVKAEPLLSPHAVDHAHCDQVSTHKTLHEHLGCPTDPEVACRRRRQAAAGRFFNAKQTYSKDLGTRCRDSLRFVSVTGRLPLISACLLVLLGTARCAGRSAPRSADAGLDATRTSDVEQGPVGFDATEASPTPNQGGETGDDVCGCPAGYVCSPFDDPSHPCVHHCYSAELDGDETDINCGGAECKPCLAGKKCQQGTDCASGECRDGLCAGTCNDGLQTDDETNVDCGGARCPACAVDFAPAISSPLGVKPQALVAGDFDGDGHLELAATDMKEEAVYVLKGRGDGTFDSPRRFPVGSWPFSLVAADLNGDGLLDLATTDFYDDALTLLAGDGKAGFSTLGRLQLESNAGPHFVTVGDLNQDGKLDLVVVCFHYKSPNGDADLGANDVRAWLNQGAGAFKAGDRWSAGENPSKVAIADLDADGHLDLAVAEYGGDGVLVLLGTGTGAMKPAQRYHAFSTVMNVLALDLSGNGALSLVASNNGYYSVSVLPPLGGGTFGPPTNYDFWGQAVDIVSADFNRDGLPDVATADIYRGVSVLVAKGHGALEQTALSFPTTRSPTTLVSGDFNGDGRMDLAVLSSDKALLEVLLGR